jgi:hypothetical protein
MAPATTMITTKPNTMRTLAPEGWCYRRDYLRTTVGAPARIFGDDFSLGD